MYSVIIPIYNSEEYLVRCIDSVLAQTAGDFELILVDDGSKDRSGDICKKYQEKDSRIKYIRKENPDAVKAGLKAKEVECCKKYGH